MAKPMTTELTQEAVLELMRGHDLEQCGSHRIYTFWIHVDQDKLPVLFVEHTTELQTVCVYALVLDQLISPAVLYMVALGTIQPAEYEAWAVKVVEHWER